MQLPTGAGQGSESVYAMPSGCKLPNQFIRRRVKMRQRFAIHQHGDIYKRCRT